MKWPAGMNKQEAEKIIKILLTADGGCEYCTADLIKLFGKRFPEFGAIADESFRKAFAKSAQGSKRKDKEELYEGSEETC